MRLFRATPKTTTIQRTGVAKTDRKSMPPKDPTRQDTTNNKTQFSTSKLLIFGAKSPSKNNLDAKSARTHVSGVQKSPPERSWRAPGAQNKTLVTSKSAQEEL